MEKNKYTAIELLSKHHAEYIKIAKVLAANNYEVKNYAEDFVQEAYLKLLRYDDLFDKVVKKDGVSVSKGYMFFVLRSIILNTIKKKSNLNYNHIGDQYDMDKEYQLDGSTVDSERLGIEALESKMYQILKENAKWFDYELFKMYLTSKKSFRTIADETKIGVRTIYLSIKRSKMIIAEKLFEDYQDYINGNYDLI